MPVVPGSIPGPASYFRFSFLIGEGLVNCLGDLSLLRKSVVRLTDRPLHDHTYLQYNNSDITGVRSVGTHERLLPCL